MNKKNLFIIALCMMLFSINTFGEMLSVKIEAILNGNIITYNGVDYAAIPAATKNNTTVENINGSTLTLLTQGKFIKLKEYSSLNSYVYFDLQFVNHENTESRLYDSFYIEYYQNGININTTINKTVSNSDYSEITKIQNGYSLRIPIVIKTESKNDITAIVKDSITYQEISRFVINIK